MWEQVDNHQATKGNIIDLLIGNDVPGSLVAIKYRRGAHEFTHTLVRASTKDLADKRRMFDLLCVVPKPCILEGQIRRIIESLTQCTRTHAHTHTHTHTHTHPRARAHTHTKAHKHTL